MMKWRKKMGKIKIVFTIIVLSIVFTGCDSMRAQQKLQKLKDREAYIKFKNRTIIEIKDNFSSLSAHKRPSFLNLVYNNFKNLFISYSVSSSPLLFSLASFLILVFMDCRCFVVNIVL